MKRVRNSDTAAKSSHGFLATFMYAVSIALISAATAYGGIVIEQSEITGQGDYGTGQGQSFLLPPGATAAAIQLHIGSVGHGGGSIKLRLWEATGGPGSSFTRNGTEPFATGTLYRNDITDTPGWFTIPLDHPYVNQAEHPVYLVFEMELLTSGGEGWNDYSYSNHSSYSGGHSVYWTASGYAIRDGEDLTFRILNSSDPPAFSNNTIAFTAATATVNEGEWLDIEIQVTGDEFDNMDVQLEIVKIAGAGSDVSLPPWISLYHYNLGGTSLHYIPLYVPDDMVLNGPTVYRVRMLIDSPQYTIAPPGYIDITIIDNDVAGTVFFDRPMKVLREGEASSVLVRRLVNDPGSLEVRVVSQSGSAVEGSDFGAVDHLVVFPEGVYSKELELQLRPDDSVPRPPLNFFLHLLAPGPDVTLVEPYGMEVIINDKDDPGSLVRSYAFSFPEPLLEISNIDIAADGRVFALARFSLNSPSASIYRVLVFTTEGEMELSWEIPLPSVFSTMSCIVLDDEGRLYVGGRVLRRYFLDGTPDAAWTNPITGMNDVKSIHVLPTGGIIVAGRITDPIQGASRAQAARFHPDGTLDPSFDLGNVQPHKTINWIYSIIPVNNGKFLIAGDFQSIQGLTRRLIARIHHDGTLDPGFNCQINQSYSAIIGLHLLPDGSILCNLAGATRNVTRLTQNGAPFPGFQGLAGRLLGVQADGKYFVLANNRIIRGLAHGPADPDWHALPQSASWVNKLQVGPDNLMHIAGRFFAYDYAPTSGMATMIGGQGASGGLIEWATEEIPVGEGIGEFDIQIRRSESDLQDPAAVFFEISMQAADGSPADTQSGFATFAPGAEFATIRVPLEDDSEPNNTRLGSAVLHHPTSGVFIGGVKQLGLEIVDDDADDDEAWLARHFPATPRDRSVFLDDSNGDGTANAIKWMTGLHPWQQSSGRMPRIVIPNAEEPPGAFDYCGISFYHDTSRTGFVTRVEASPSLETDSWREIWNSRDDPGLESERVICRPDGPGWMTVISDKTFESREFMRIRYDEDE